jgi:hypothetical protein
MDPNARFEQLRNQLLQEPTSIHSLRLERVLVNIEAQSNEDSHDGHLADLISRVGDFAGGLASDLKMKTSTLNDAIALLEDLAAIGDLAFDLWSITNQPESK